MHKDLKKCVYSDSSLLPHVRHREADSLGPGLPQGRHARVPERGDDRRHPESVSTITKETLTELCNAFFLASIQ